MILNIVYSLIAQTIVSIVSIILFMAYENWLPTGGATSNSFDTIAYIAITCFSQLLLFISGMLLKSQGTKLSNFISVSVASIILIAAWILRNDDGSYIVLNLPFLPLFYVLSNNKIAGLLFAFAPSLMLWIGIEHKNKNNK